QVGQIGLQEQQGAGKVKVNQAASGVDVNSGSALAVQKTQGETSRMSELNARSDAARRAYGLEIKSNQYEGQAALDRAEQSKDKTQGFISGAGSMLGAAAQADMYSEHMSTKGFGTYNPVAESGVDSSATSSSSADFMQ